MNKHLLEYILPHIGNTTFSKSDIESLLYYCDGDIHAFKDALLACMYADKDIFTNTEILENGIKTANIYGWSIVNIEFNKNSHP